MIHLKECLAHSSLYSFTSTVTPDLKSIVNLSSQTVVFNQPADEVLFKKAATIRICRL